MSQAFSIMQGLIVNAGWTWEYLLRASSRYIYLTVLTFFSFSFTRVQQKDIHFWLARSVKTCSLCSFSKKKKKRFCLVISMWICVLFFWFHPLDRPSAHCASCVTFPHGWFLRGHAALLCLLIGALESRLRDELTFGSRLSRRSSRSLRRDSYTSSVPLS